MLGELGSEIGETIFIPARPHCHVYIELRCLLAWERGIGPIMWETFHNFWIYLLLNASPSYPSLNSRKSLYKILVILHQHGYRKEDKKHGLKRVPFSFLTTTFLFFLSCILEANKVLLFFYKLNFNKALTCCIPIILVTLPFSFIFNKSIATSEDQLSFFNFKKNYNL